MAFEHFLAGPTQVAAIHLKALLNGTVIAEVLATQARRIARACGLLLRRARMLGQRSSASDE